jgi:energy-coupling factor transporter ATP-binding protein EcfA2
VSSVLELREVDASYGAFRSLFGVSLSVGRGEAGALVGPNGAGKTTVARVASGLLVPRAGSVLVDGDDLTRRRTHAFARAGVAHAPKGARSSPPSPSRRTWHCRSAASGAGGAGPPGCATRTSCSPSSASGGHRWRAEAMDRVQSSLHVEVPAG